jgi:hypothetical protein
MVAVYNGSIEHDNNSVVTIDDLAKMLSIKDPEHIPEFYATALIGAWISFIHYIVLERIKEDNGFLSKLQTHNGYVELDESLTPNHQLGVQMIAVLVSASGLLQQRVESLLGGLADIFYGLASQQKSFEPLGQLLWHKHAVRIRLVSDFLEPTIDEPQLILPDEDVIESEEDMDEPEQY